MEAITGFLRPRCRCYGGIAFDADFNPKSIVLPSTQQLLSMNGAKVSPSLRRYNLLIVACLVAMVARRLLPLYYELVFLFLNSCFSDRTGHSQCA